jgi:hypothetical protein
VVTIYRKSPFTGEQGEMTFAVDADVFKAAHIAWEKGAMIQDAFPFLSAGEREFLKTGITPEEWDHFIGEEE